MDIWIKKKSLYGTDYFVVVEMYICTQDWKDYTRTCHQQANFTPTLQSISPENNSLKPSGVRSASTQWVMFSLSKKEYPISLQVLCRKALIASRRILLASPEAGSIPLMDVFAELLRSLFARFMKFDLTWSISVAPQVSWVPPTTVRTRALVSSGVALSCAQYSRYWYPSHRKPVRAWCLYRSQLPRRRVHHTQTQHSLMTEFCGPLSWSRCGILINGTFIFQLVELWKILNPAKLIRQLLLFLSVVRRRNKFSRT